MNLEDKEYNNNTEGLIVQMMNYFEKQIETYDRLVDLKNFEIETLKELYKEQIDKLHTRIAELNLKNAMNNSKQWDVDILSGLK